MRQHTLSVLVTFDPSARKAAAPGDVDGPRIGVVVRPGSEQYFPAVIRRLESPSPQGIAHAMLRIHLTEDEAETLFYPGQAFIIWADAIVSDEAIRGEGLLGNGVVLDHDSAAETSASSQEPAQAEADRAIPYRRIVVPARRGTAAGTMAGRP